MTTADVKLREAQHALSIVEAERDIADRKVRDLEMALQAMKENANEWQSTAHAAERARDTLETEAVELELSASTARGDAMALEERLESFAQDAIVLLPRADETMEEAARRRIRELESLVDKLHDKIVEPPILQRRRVELELDHEKHLRLFGEILAACASAEARGGHVATTRWVSQRTRETLGASVVKILRGDTGAELTISDWASRVAGLLTTIAEGVPHEPCGCEACRAHELLSQATALGVMWSDPTAELIRETAAEAAKGERR